MARARLFWVRFAIWRRQWKKKEKAAKKEKKERSASGNFKWRDGPPRDPSGGDDGGGTGGGGRGGGGAGRPPLSEAQKFLLSWLHDLYDEGLL